MKSKIILIGGGGHCKSCIDVIEQEKKYRIEGIVDIPEKLHHKVLGYEIIATDEDLPRLASEYSTFLITIGQKSSPDKRVDLFLRLQKLGAKFPAIFSPLSYVSEHAKVGEGTIIMHGALVNAGATIGNNCIINTNALIEHDAAVSDHCHISTGVVINGGVLVGEKTFFGSNAVSKDNIEIGKCSVIGFNARVSQNLPDGSRLK
jgi:sugar O-acyltransferase (sialic acid O-acetyltransferase NeuD family)